MTARVREWYPAQVSTRSLYVGEPYTTQIASRIKDRVNHILGSDLPEVHYMHWGHTEAGVGSFTYRFLYPAHPNARALFFAFIPRGHVASGKAYGTIFVPGADAPNTVRVHKRNADVTTLADIEEEVTFVKAITAGAFQEVTYTVTDLRMHSVVVFEVPRGQVSGTQKHLDRSFAFHDRFIDDEAAGGADPRGHPQLLQAIDDARTYCRRCATPYSLPAQAATNPAADGVWTTVTGWDKIRLRGRTVQGAANPNRMTTRVFIRAACTGGTWQFRMVGASTSAASANFSGAEAWRPGSAALTDGVLWELQDSALETARLEVQRVTGPGSVTVPGVGIFEAAV